MMTPCRVRSGTYLIADVANLLHAALAVNGDRQGAHVAWARGFAAKIAPYATVAEYVNYMTADTQGDRVRAAHSDAKYARLRELRKRYVPDNVFRFDQNIPPSE